MAFPPTAVQPVHADVPEPDPTVTPDCPTVAPSPIAKRPFPVKKNMLQQEDFLEGAIIGDFNGEPVRAVIHRVLIKLE